MKKVLSLILCFVMVLALLCGCGNNGQTEKETTETTAETVQGDGVLKILAIGNSFSQDATQMLYEIATKEGYEDVVIGNLYDPGCTLKGHVENFTAQIRGYNYWFNDAGRWITTEGVTLEYGLKAQEWDIITMQQGSPDSGLVETYNEDLQTLIDYVNQNKTNPNAKFYWHMTWAYPKNSNQEVFFTKYSSDQMTMYNMIVGAVKEKIVPNEAFVDVLPVGTAIQNARTSYIGDKLNRDGFHLNDLGRVIAGYTWFSMLTGKNLDTIALESVPSKLCKSYELMGDMPITEGQRLVIAEAVKNAIANPYTVTQSQYTTEPGK